MNQAQAAIAADKALKAIAVRVLASKGPMDIPNWIRTSKPYLLAIRNNDYGWEDPVMCVCYALNNMTGWKGDTAKYVKKELNEAIK